MTMTPERWAQVNELVHRAMELAREKRVAFLDGACAADLDLRHEVETLLDADEHAGTIFLQSQASIRLAKGSRLGDYEIQSLLGAGGMGEVYRALDLRLRREVAIKVLPALVSANPDRWRRFEQEAMAAAALNHPNILAVFQFGTHDGAPYLVSELLQGETLREVIKRGPIEPRKAIDQAKQIANGLAEAHHKAIVHRDLKPENLFVTRDGRMKILDFGLAKLEQRPGSIAGGNETQPGTVMGTVGYMSPEQVRGETADHRADIFAFGSILYEMLTGQRAFQKSTSVETMASILNEDPPAIAQVKVPIPPALERVVCRCLEKNAEQRFQSASDLAFALDAALHSGSTNTIAIPTSNVRRNLQLGLVAVAIVVAATFAAYLTSRHPHKLTNKDTIVLADFANSTGDAIFDDTLKQALSIGLEQSPFFKILSDQRIQDTLKLMNRPADQRLTPDVAREICQRTGSTAMLVGSISSLGSEYVVGLNAVHCATGDTLVQNQAEAQRKEDVLKTLDESIRNLRTTLGESLSSVQKYDAPLTEATTSSLDALKAFSLAVKAQNEKGDIAAIPYYRRAIELDPRFAAAYAQLGMTYIANLTEPGAAAENLEKAYELRERVSEREQSIITVNYQRLNGRARESRE